MTAIHEIAKNPEFREKLKGHLSIAFEDRLDGVLDRIAYSGDLGRLNRRKSAACSG